MLVAPQALPRRNVEAKEWERQANGGQYVSHTVTQRSRGADPPSCMQGRGAFSSKRGCEEAGGEGARGQGDPGASSCQQGPGGEETHAPSDELGAVLRGRRTTSQCCGFLKSIFFFQITEVIPVP